jgi:ADP-dependent NAD(P)H-hydrate dehydratase / NAD(P)H-hydrate epimerase
VKVLSPQRMARYDRYAIETWGIPSAVLMENAGRTAYRLMKDLYLKEKRRIAFFCGRGNNGGDGFVMARYALRDRFPVSLFLLGRKADLKGDALANMELYASLGGEIVEVTGLESIRSALSHAHVVVDAIFGTGLSKGVDGLEREVIEEINASGKVVVSVDIPSGIDGSTGEPLGAAVRADHTFTFAYPKPGHLIYPGAYFRGRLTVIDISIPAIAEELLGHDAILMDGDLLRGFLQQRLPWSHKGTYGHLAVVAGSPGKTGAAHMAALSALKIGAGLVTLAVPRSLNTIMEVKLTEVMTLPVEDEGTGYFSMSAYDELMEFLADKDALVVGPGLSQRPDTAELVRAIYREWGKPVVVDADGINAFKDATDDISGGRQRAVFTPHPGELARITERSTSAINADRIGAARSFVEKHGVTLVLKGAPTIIASPGGETFINPTGNAALAKGGSGDVLTGFIGGLIAQTLDPLKASLLGTYLHGYLADDWVEEQGTDFDLLATDLLTGLGKAVRMLRDGTERIYVHQSL